MITVILLATILTQSPLAERPRHALAPSLPQLTEKEEAALAEVIDRFIQFDIGKLKGKEGEKALADFKGLGPEAIFQLVEGLNRAANMEGSCPAVLIGRKITQLVNGSRDGGLIDFVRENAGAEVKAKRHLGVIADVKLACQFRKAALQREEIAARKGGAGGPKSARTMTVPELVKAVDTEGGARLKEVLVELETRPGDQVLPTLVVANRHYDAEIKQLGQNLLVRYLSRQKAEQLKERLKDERAEVRSAAAGIVGQKKYKLGGDLIALLEDNQEDVRTAARRALVQISGQDFGPSPGASAADRAEAIQLWRGWWEKAGGH